LLIKKKACGGNELKDLKIKFLNWILGARSFYVIDTDKKQLIEVEANSKDDLEK
jgi:hypothetical protein